MSWLKCRKSLSAFRICFLSRWTALFSSHWTGYSNYYISVNTYLSFNKLSILWFSTSKISKCFPKLFGNTLSQNWANYFIWSRYSILIKISIINKKLNSKISSKMTQEWHVSRNNKKTHNSKKWIMMQDFILSVDIPESRLTNMNHPIRLL